MSVFSGINISTSALTAERMRMDVISENLANAQTTRTKTGLPYNRKVAVFQERHDNRSFFKLLDESRNIKKSLSNQGNRVLYDNRSKYKAGAEKSENFSYESRSLQDKSLINGGISNIRNRYSGNNTAGVEVVGVTQDNSPFKMKYDPGHPDANEEGYVMMSNVDPIVEMVDMISAQRSYEANVTAINTSKAILNKALEIGK